MVLESQLKMLKRGVQEIISEEELVEKLKKSEKEGRALRVKYGADPSAPDIHLGHTVPLRKLKQFQDLGHEVIFVIGDFTGRIGDPSGRSETRRQLTEEEVFENARTYHEQVSKILDPQRTRITFNNEWLGKLSFADVIRLASKYTVARMLERDDFRGRLSEQKPIGVHEFLYPLAQAYDSVALQADVELGGTDQTFNFVMTRDIQREFGQVPQVVITMPLLEGTDGVMKMSKSYGNYIGLNDPPSVMYGKTMSIPDEIMVKWFELLTAVPEEEVIRIKDGLSSGSLHPKDVKMVLAREIVTMYWGADSARAAEQEFKQVFEEGGLPHQIPVVPMDRRDLVEGKMWIVELLTRAGLAPSRSEARRLVTQGGVRVDQRRVTDDEVNVPIRDGLIIQVGKRRFAQIRLER